MPSGQAVRFSLRSTTHSYPHIDFRPVGHSPGKSSALPALSGQVFSEQSTPETDLVLRYVLVRLQFSGGSTCRTLDRLRRLTACQPRQDTECNPRSALLDSSESLLLGAWMGIADVWALKKHSPLHQPFQLIRRGNKSRQARWHQVFSHPGCLGLALPRRCPSCRL